MADTRNKFNEQDLLNKKLKLLNQLYGFENVNVGDSFQDETQTETATMDSSKRWVQLTADKPIRDKHANRITEGFALVFEEEIGNTGFYSAYQAYEDIYYENIKKYFKEIELPEESLQLAPYEKRTKGLGPCIIVCSKEIPLLALQKLVYPSSVPMKTYTMHNKMDETKEVDFLKKIFGELQFIAHSKKWNNEKKQRKCLDLFKNYKRVLSKEEASELNKHIEEHTKEGQYLFFLTEKTARLSLFGSTNVKQKIFHVLKEAGMGQAPSLRIGNV